VACTSADSYVEALARKAGADYYTPPPALATGNQFLIYKQRPDKKS